MVELRDEIRAAIAAAAGPAVAQKVKQAVPGARTLGVPVPHLRQLAAGVRRDRPDLSLEDAGDPMDALCRDGWREEILVGAFLLGRYGRRLARLPWNRLHPGSPRWTIGRPVTSWLAMWPESSLRPISSWSTSLWR